MNIIEFDRWKSSADDPRKSEYAGQRTAAEVFQELKHRLESQAYLSDEYFLLNGFWENGQEIPKDAGIFCTTDYGGSEGVYLDAYLKWFDEGQEKSVTQKFFTGKTLGENGNDLDRMFLISSAITKAFHGDNATHARYMKIGGTEDDTGGRVIHLSQQEEKVFIEALVEQRERQEQAMSQTEQLLRRMTGSITAYMDTVGQRPLRLDDYDRVVLAIRDGELNAFQALLPNLKEIIKQSTDEQIAAAPPYLLEQFAADKDFRILSALVEKGISGGPNAWRTLHMLTYEGRSSWIAEDALKKRMWVDANDYDAFHACVKNDAVKVCKLLLDGGIDFDQYRRRGGNPPLRRS
nr:ankyrin repeat domain-containing protein [uncultured Oscillibacter sp.]